MDSYPGTSGPSAGFGAATWLLIIVAYIIIFCYPLFVIAKKTGRSEDAWWAWIPILNIVLMCRIADKPDWWVIWSFIPIANIVVTVIVWMGIARAVSKPEWLGILMLIPIANVIIPFYLAFG